MDPILISIYLFPTIHDADAWKMAMALFTDETGLGKGKLKMHLYVGWKPICSLLGCKDPKTAKKWVKRYHIPVVWVTGRPAISDAQFEDWWSRMQKEAHSKEKIKK